MNSLLEEAIESWQDTREGVVAEVENFPAQKFDFRPLRAKPSDMKMPHMPLWVS